MEVIVTFHSAGVERRLCVIEWELEVTTTSMQPGRVFWQGQAF